jgi:hypothetical protein
LINAVSISLTVLLFFPGEVLPPEVTEEQGRREPTRLERFGKCRIPWRVDAIAA